MKVGLQLLNSLSEDKLLFFLRDALLKIRTIIDNAHLGFGDGVDNDNIFGVWKTYTTNAVANTEDTVAHNLGVIPVGWIVVVQDKAGNIYKGTTTWTTSSIFLKCSVASMTVTIFILGPSNKNF